MIYSYVMNDDRELEKVGKFFGKFPLVVYKKGDFILRADDITPPGIFFIKEGFVRQFLISKKGEMFVVHVFQPGSFFLMTWAINSQPNSYNFEAFTNCHLYKAPLLDVRNFVKENPEIMYNFTSRLLRGLDGLLTRMEYLMVESSYIKTASLLLYLAEKFGQKEGGSIIIHLSLTHKEIASWIGTTRETASLQLEQMKKQGFIDYQRKYILIRNPQNLQKEIRKIKDGV